MCEPVPVACAGPSRERGRADMLGGSTMQPDTATPRLRLYGPGEAPFTQKVIRALGLKKLDWELFEPAGPDDYRRWSPDTGLLPVLRIGDDRVDDSTRILLALDERFPQPPLLSADPKIATAQRGLVDWVDESFFWYWRRYQERLSQAERDGSPPRPSARWWQRWFTSGSAGRAPVDERIRFLIDEVENRLDDLVAMLGPRPYFYSDRPSMADLAVYAMLRSIERRNLAGAEEHLAARAPLVALMRRVEQATDPSPRAR